jgi:hypothetical protein
MAKQENPTRKASRSEREKRREADNGNGSDAPKTDGSESYEKELAAYLQERIRPGLNRGSIPMLARSIAKEIAKRDHPNGTPDQSAEDDEVTAEGAEDEAAVEAEGEDAADAEGDDDADAEGDDDEVAAEAEDEDVAEDEDEDDDEAVAESDEEDEDVGESDEDDAETEDEEDEAPTAFEEDMYELQAEFGDDWIVRFSVQNDAGWLTAERADGSHRLEAPTADVLREAVALLNERGGRPS